MFLRPRFNSFTREVYRVRIFTKLVTLTRIPAMLADLWIHFSNFGQMIRNNHEYVSKKSEQ